MELEIEEEVEILKGKATSVRFSDIEWFHPGIPVLVGGAGGIGSWLTFFLARQECKIYLHDYDEVDETNLGGQLYGASYIGQSKVEAMMSISDTFCNNDKVSNMGKFTEDSYANTIMFSAFDNMSSRKLMFEKWKAQDDREIFIDGRMLAESAQIFTVRKGDEDRYEEWLFNDDEVEDVACSMKATSHCGAMTAGFMVSAFNNYITNVKTKREFREVPFRTVFELPTVTQEVTV
jgi:molybdopterin/thiamine biosynthesis adenylyltransferase